MSKKVRVRFAPSPTGPLHIGGVRTALFNYLFAKKNGGDFILRIEDTDRSRFIQGAEEYIVESLNWLGLDFDESPFKGGDCAPYRQSERKSLYKKYADLLLQSGDAYYAFDSSEELAGLRKEYESQGKTFIYNWHNREGLNNSLSLSPEEVSKKIEAGENYVIRFRAPKGETLVLNDIIRGEIKIDTSVLDDKILFKSDGMPTYHLANIVDDHLMQITHVIRGEEWLPSLALHVLLYRALGWKSPEFAHLPLILKPTGKGKLSKRDGDKMGFPVFPIEWKTQDNAVFSGYREGGYFPEAVVNMLALLGWNSGSEQEIFSLNQLIKSFDLKRVNKAGARFDPEKTKWFQHHYLQQKSDEEIAVLFLPLVEKEMKQHRVNKEVASPNTLSKEKAIKIVSLLKERATFISDFWEQGRFFFVAPTTYNSKAAKKAFKEETPQLLKQLIKLLNEMEAFSSQEVSGVVKGWITSQEMGFGKVMMPLRLALVGDMKGPDVFEIASVLGKTETLKRLTNAVEFIKTNS